jgi:hypothetical protein
MRGRFLVVAAACLAAATAQAQDTDASKDDPLVKDVVEILAQPGRDFGIVPTRVPELLERLIENPYDLEETRNCAAIRGGIARLTALIGPDYDDPVPEGESRQSQLAKTGLRAGMSSIVPFRGLVREATGAAAADRRRLEAIQAAYARRGFLRGLAQQRNCRR